MGENYAYMDADEVMELQDIKVGGITRAKTWFLRKQYTRFTELLSLLVESYAVPLRVFYRSSTSNREKLVEEPNLFRNDKQIYMQR